MAQETAQNHIVQVGGRITTLLGQSESESVRTAGIMSENAPHREFKNKLLQFIRADVAGQQALRWVDIAFPCDDHLHLWKVPSQACWAESERQRTSPQGLAYRPDVIILDQQDLPIAILEVTATNQKNHSQRAAEQLQIPWFRFWAPPPEATQAELTTRAYARGNAGLTSSSNEFTARIDGWQDEKTGGMRYGPIYHTEVAPGSVSIGPILYANSTNISCERADWNEQGEELWQRATRHRDKRLQTAQDIGSTILHEMETMHRNPQTFTAGIGDRQLHGDVGIYSLNPDPGTKKYRATDITTLLETWQEENLEMHRNQEAFQRHRRTTPPPFLPDSQG